MKKTNAQLVEENSQLERQIQGLRVIEEKDNLLLDEKDKEIGRLKNENKVRVDAFISEMYTLKDRNQALEKEIKTLKINQAVEAMTFIKSALMLINYVNEPKVTHRVKSYNCQRATAIFEEQYQKAQKALRNIIDSDNLPF